MLKEVLEIKERLIELILNNERDILISTKNLILSQGMVFGYNSIKIKKSDILINENIKDNLILAFNNVEIKLEDRVLFLLDIFDTGEYYLISFIDTNEFKELNSIILDIKELSQIEFINKNKILIFPYTIKKNQHIVIKQLIDLMVKNQQ
jgi:hypothetical protein